MKDTIFAILMSLFAGANVWQFLFYRSTKKKYEAEARQAETEAAKGKVDLQQDQYDYVSEQLSKIQKEYYDLAKQFRETMTSHLLEIDEKCNEIAGLKSKITYYKGLRCYKPNCQMRLYDNPTNKNADK